MASSWENHYRLVGIDSERSFGAALPDWQSADPRQTDDAACRGVNIFPHD